MSNTRSASRAAKQTRRPKQPKNPAVDTRTVKEIMQGVVERLPSNCSWDDVMYEVYVCQKIAAGLADAAAGRFVSDEEMDQEFGR